MASFSGSEWRCLCEKYQRSVFLSEIESKQDPDNDPFRSKYSARDLLKEIKATIVQADGGGNESDLEQQASCQQDIDPELQGPGIIAGESCVCPASLASLRRAVIEYQLGVNHTETEELSAGEEHLMNCVRLLETFEATPESISLLIQARNQLGILWAGRDETDKAQSFLENAELLYTKYTKEIGKPPLDASEFFMAEEQKLTEQERSRRFEKAYTYTLYYLAQVYKNQEQNEKAARYCHATLQRQLEFNDFIPLEWAINAATLSQYYITKSCYMEGRHCLAAASVVFELAGEIPSEAAAQESEAENEKREQLCQRGAEIARCWIKYCLNLLLDAKKMLEDNIGELDLDRQDELKAKRRQEEEAKEIDRKTAVLFGSSDTFDSILAVEEKVSCAYPLDFDEARAIFLYGQNNVNVAKEYFKMDGHVTDHIEILQDHSALFKALAFFEEDYERCCKMHKRRIDMLEPVCKDLNPQYYLLICRQLQFELGDTYFEMMDLKIALANKQESLDSHTIKKINHLIYSSISFYEQFLESLKNAENKFPEKLEEDVLRPALVAKFRIARLYSRIISSDGNRQLETLSKSVEYYKYVVDYCEQNPDSKKAVETELELSEEMLGLLPVRIERLRAKLNNTCN
ncbi:KIF-binding protein [Polypterus senegalus]|uniref:KIF-binding protein n=1 Tax=Polypterus senegalus TaxID=55291 RepID=UPI001962A911|nr:KIF-binding protein [Polypterus senegalus]